MNSRLTPSYSSGRHYVLAQLTKHMTAIAARHIAGRKQPLVVDFGCGDMPYRPLFEAHGARYLGIDLESSPAAELHPKPDGSAPVESASVDVVLSTQVLEHVPDPQVYLAECRRILKPGGLLILSTHGYWMYHPHPGDLWRWTGSGLRATVTAAGFRTVEFRGVMGLASAGLHLFQDGLLRRLPGVARPVISLLIHPFIVLSDKLSTDKERQDDACVFIMVAERSEE